LTLGCNDRRLVGHENDVQSRKGRAHPRDVLVVTYPVGSDDQPAQFPFPYEIRRTTGYFQ